MQYWCIGVAFYVLFRLFVGGGGGGGVGKEGLGGLGGKGSG